jgi:serine/threonine protein kinase
MLFFEGFLISNIFLGLEYLHERNIVHLGIHPKHILINNDGYYKLIGFKSMKKVLVTINASYINKLKNILEKRDKPMD